MPPSPEPTPDTPFQLLVVGDFTGRDVGGHRGTGGGDASGSATGREPRRITSVDAFLERLRPTVQLRGPGATPTRVSFQRVEDFHPDRLLERVPHLLQLVEAIDPLVEEHAEGGAEDDGRDGSGAPRSDQGTGPAPPPVEGLLDEIVAASAPGESGSPAGSSADPHMVDLQAWVRDLVAPHVTEAESTGQQALRARLEGEVSLHLRRLLHAEPVRTLEALWRSLLALGATVTSVPDARLFALDLSRRELDATLVGDDPAASPLARALTERLPGPAGAAPFAAAVLAFDFGPEPSDVLVLNRAAMVAHGAGVPLLAGAAPETVGLERYAPRPGSDAWDGRDEGAAEDSPPAWAAFRSTEAARSVALLAPRVLLRAPYGADTDPLDTLPFEEASGDHDEYLWGNPAFVAAEGLALGFAQRGWGLDPAAARDFAPRPLHVGPEGEVLAHPVERVGRSDEERRFRAAGVTPVLAFREAARLRVTALSSAARPPAPLTAWWMD